jgi:hypothetical protein
MDLLHYNGLHKLHKSMLHKLYKLMDLIIQSYTSRWSYSVPSNRSYQSLLMFIRARVTS